MVTFNTILIPGGGNNVGISVPEDIVLSFDKGKRVPVVVTINGGYSYRNTITPMGGEYLISFNSETRKATGLGAGDEAEVTLEYDDQPRSVELPPELAAAFKAHPEAADAWAKWSYSKQRQFAEPIAAAKAEDTKQRRVEKAIEALLGA